MNAPLYKITDLKDKPLVSVVIPCYNQGRFLPEAIQSVKDQTYPNIEIIVVNDGSTDCTDESAKSFTGIKYFEQGNLGLPNARNRGMKESQGKYVTFLDADDLLYPDAVEKNLPYLIQNPALAFVSGRFLGINEKGKTWVPKTHLVDKNHYIAMLQTNYIGNPAAVLYSRWILDICPFDTSPKIKGCEDYDHYLKITRSYPVKHHQESICIYRKHGGNMSDDYLMMLESVLHVLNRQLQVLQTEEEINAFQIGIVEWKGMYLNWIFESLLHKDIEVIPKFRKKMFWKFRKDILQIFWIKFKIKTKSLLVKTDKASHHDLFQ